MATDQKVERTSSAKAKADIDRTIAETERFRAEARQLIATAREQEASAAMREHEAALTLIELNEKQRFRERELARDKYHHVYRYTNPITEASVKACIDELTVWHRTDPGCSVEVIFNSPGGEVNAGMDLFDYLLELRENGHYLVTHTRGWAASMGGILLQAGNKRTMGSEAYVLIHQIRTGIIGKIGEIEDEMVFINKMSNRILNIFAERSKEAHTAGTAAYALTAKQFAKGDTKLGISGWERRDWWLDSGECLKYGIVDSVR